MGLLSLILRPASPDAFARKSMRILKSAGAGEVEYKKDEFLLMIAESGMINLANFYAEYRRLPVFKRKVAYEQLLAVYQQQKQSRPMDFAADKQQFLPRLRHKSYFEIALLQFPESAGQQVFPHRGIAEDLCAEIVRDEEHACQTLMDKQFEELGKSFEELWPIATDNLYRISNQEYVEFEPGLFVSPFGDSHDAARLVLPDLFRNMRVKGNVIAAPVKPHVVFFCGNDHAASISRMAELCLQEMQAGGRVVTGRMYELANDRWAPLRLEKDHPSYWLVRRNELIDRVGSYNDQMQLLDQKFKKSGRDCFVGKLDILGYKDSPVLWSWAVWVEGITDALMPRCDVIAIAAGNGDPPEKRFVMWDDAQRVAGHHFKSNGEALERFHMTTFPSPEELSKMKFVSADEVAQLLQA